MLTIAGGIIITVVVLSVLYVVVMVGMRVLDDVGEKSFDANLKRKYPSYRE